jgi:putative MATE family efflux protein
MSFTQSSENRFVQMVETPIPKLIPQLAIPPIISMLITSAYNMADTYFVSQISTSASGAVGVDFSLMAIIQAIGFMLGMGSGTYVSRLLGQKDRLAASRVASTGFFTSLLAGIVLTCLGLLFIEPLIYWLGATPTIFPYAKDYAQYILIGAPYMTASYVMNNILRAQGNAFLAMLGIATGAILNVALDPIFIFVLDLGIGGAALATILSQFISFLILLYLCVKDFGGIQIKFKYFKPSKFIYYEILRNGLPSFYRQGLASLAVISLNFCAAPYGDAAIAAMSIVARILHFLVSAMLGFGQGFMPVCGFNYGAKHYNRVIEAFWFSFKVMLCFFIIIGLSFFIIAEPLITFFRKSDPQVILIGVRALRLQCLFLPLQAWIIITNMFTQAIGKAWQASLISISRQGLFFIPLIFTLPSLLQILGLQLAQPIADAATCILATWLTLPIIKEIDSYKQK